MATLFISREKVPLIINKMIRIGNHMKNAYSVTFGDRAESHVGMQIIGELAYRGLTYEELQTTKERFEG